MKEFIINNYLKLKLIDNRTYIFINDELFNHCKYILLDIPVEQIEDFDEIESIDEAAEKLDHSLERRFEKNIIIPPETEFWGHASNLQCWWENKYDTRLLHSNLAFPLLKKLTEAGDPQAKRVFKEEIAKRFMKGYLPVTTYLIKEGYLFYLSKEEFETILDSKALSEIDPNDKNAWENLGYLYSVNGEYNKAIDAYNHIIAIDSNDIRTWLRLGLVYRKHGQYNNAIEAYKQALKINPNDFVIWRDFDKLLEEPYFLYLFLDSLPENLKKTLLTRLITGNNKNPERTITNLLSTELTAFDKKHIIYKGKIFAVEDNHLSLSNQNIEDISDIIGLESLSGLHSLNLHFNHISEIKGFEKLHNLKQLVLNSNQVSDITDLENLKCLEKLDLKNNQISEIKGLEKLVNLDYLNLPKNKITEIKGLDTLRNLKQLVLNFNQISEIKGLENLSNLEILDLRYNQIKRIKGLEQLVNLKELYLSSNPLYKITGLETLKNLEILDLSNTKITEVPDFLTSLSSLKKLILINCNVIKFPKSLEEIIISYTREDRKELLQKGFDFTFDDIELFEKSSSNRALMGGKPTEFFKIWLQKRKSYPNKVVR